MNSNVNFPSLLAQLAHIDLSYILEKTSNISSFVFSFRTYENIFKHLQNVNFRSHELQNFVNLQFKIIFSVRWEQFCCYQKRKFSRSFFTIDFKIYSYTRCSDTSDCSHIWWHFTHSQNFKKNLNEVQSSLLTKVVFSKFWRTDKVSSNIFHMKYLMYQNV